MAGIGVKLNHIYEKNTIITNVIGFGYSTAVTIAPMFLIIAAIFIMQTVLDVNKIGYAQRELFSCTILYIFIFSLITTSPFGAVLARYLSDIIYEEKYQDILPCFYMGMALNVGLSALVAIPFCIHECMVGGVAAYYVLTGYCGYIALVLVFYAMMYLSICKDYQKISFFFLTGMTFTVLLSVLLVKLVKMEVTYAMLLSLTVGFVVIGSLEMTMIKCYFRENSGNYTGVLGYFKKFWKLVIINFLHISGLYVHNFVFWMTDLQMEVADSFICAMPYDMATCLAMFTNISSTVIFTSRVEMYFHGRYKAYSEAVIGGRLADIQNAKQRMFRQLSAELVNLVRLQFIVSVIIYLLFIVFLPQMGFAGLTMKIYPCLAAGYFILFIMYGAIIFLYYFNDMTGALLTTVSFFAGTLIGSMISARLPAIWYGAGMVVGSMLGWIIGYGRIRWVERNLDEHIFCNGTLMEKGKGERPSGKVMDRREAQ